MTVNRRLIQARWEVMSKWAWEHRCTMKQILAAGSGAYSLFRTAQYVLKHSDQEWVQFQDARTGEYVTRGTGRLPFPLGAIGRHSELI